MRLFDVQRHAGMRAVLRDERLIDGRVELARRVIRDVQELIGLSVRLILDDDRGGGEDDREHPEDIQPRTALRKMQPRNEASRRMRFHHRRPLSTATSQTIPAWKTTFLMMLTIGLPRSSGRT